MLLYAYYSPYEVSSHKPEKVFAFASIESCVRAMAEYGQGNDVLDLKTREFFIERGISIATLIRWNPETKCCEESGSVWINKNAIRDTWDGKMVEIHLVEHSADESVVSDVRYP